MKAIQRVILVDDDSYSHMICKGNIRRIAGGLEYVEFTDPVMGIEYIESAYNEAADDCFTALLLDINMPSMNGWEFLERYDKIENKVKDQFVIYLLSSSIDRGDKQRAAENKYVKGFLMKPFRKLMVQQILGAHLFI
jgi:CheY-like chemotaxis protein